MDPRERADATLARARARGAFVVTPESAISPMDAASTLQIPRTVVAANDERHSDPDATMVVPGSVARGRVDAPPELPAIAQEALTDVVSAPPGIRSRQRRLEDAERARQAVHRQPKPSPIPKPVSQQATQPVPQPAPPAPAPHQPEEMDGLIPTTKEPPTTRSTLSQRLDG